MSWRDPILPTGDKQLRNIKLCKWLSFHISTGKISSVLYLSLEEEEEEEEEEEKK